jgi:signal transduction histidine kinase
MNLSVNAITLKLDREKINEVLNNMVDNAIKYTPTGSIYVTVEKKTDTVRIAVKDSGVGMSKDTIDNKLFKLFSTAANSEQINVNSTGVGMYISKKHVESCGGKMWAESEGEGKGSSFIVEFSISPKI